MAIHIAPFHEQLLAVGLSAPQQTAELWRRLGPLDVAHLTDRRARKLLPLVWRSLVEAGIEDPRLPDLVAIVQQTRADNDALLVQLRSALDALDGAGIAVMGLKGVPLVVTVYGDPGLRPMTDADLLVGPADALRALEVLRGAGWRVIGKLPTDFGGRAEASFRAPTHDAVVDMHWRIEPWVTREDGRDDALWRAASRLDVAGGTMLAPSPHDLALHVILHAFRSEWERVVRWVPDLVLLLRSQGDAFDWDTFVRRTVSGGVSRQVGEALEYARDHFDAPIPESVVGAVLAVPTTRRQAHKDTVASQRPSRDHWLFPEWPEFRTRWARVSVNYSRRRAWRTFPTFLRARTGVERLWTLPFVVVTRRIRTRTSRSAARDGAASASSDERVDRTSQGP